MTVFEQIKSAVDMKTVAEGYGLDVNRSEMTLCPFHNERTPSAKIYHDSFHCFGCGEHADVIRFTQKMFSLNKPIDAAKKLNDDYGLNIEIGKAPTEAEVKEYHKRADEKRAYEEWEKQAWRVLNDYYWLMRNWRALAPKSPDEECDKRFIYSLHHLDIAEHLCMEFINCDKDGRLSMMDTVDETAALAGTISVSCTNNSAETSVDKSLAEPR